MSPPGDFLQRTVGCRPVATTFQAKVCQGRGAGNIDGSPVFVLDPDHAECAVTRTDPQCHQAFAQSEVVGGDIRKVAGNKWPGAINLPEILATHRATTDRHSRPVEVCHQFLAGQPVVTPRPAVDEVAKWIDVQCPVARDVKPRHAVRKLVQELQDRLAEYAQGAGSVPVIGVLDRGRDVINGT